MTLVCRVCVVGWEIVTVNRCHAGAGPRVRLLLLMMIGSVSVHGSSYCMSAVRGPPLSLGSWFPGSSLSFSPKEEGVGGREAGATPTAPSFQTGALGPTSSVPSVPVGVRAPSSGPPSPGSQQVGMQHASPRLLHRTQRQRTHTDAPATAVTAVQSWARVANGMPLWPSRHRARGANPVPEGRKAGRHPVGTPVGQGAGVLKRRRDMLPIAKLG